MAEEQSTPRPEVYKEDLIPNALIFLEENWREKAWAERKRDQQGVDARRSHHWGTFVVGKYNDD